MNKTIIRIISALLTLLMLTACFAGCSDPVEPETGDNGTDAPAADGTQGPADSAEVTDAPEQSLEDILGFEIPTLNKQFNVLHTTQKEILPDIIADSFDGDEVSVEVYERNLNIEENFKVEMNYIDSLAGWSKRTDNQKFVESAVQAGTNDYDLVFGSNVVMATMMYSGLFHNLCDVETINFDHSWWMPNTVETYGVGERIYGAMGEFAHSYYSALGIIAYNSTLGERFGVPAAHGDLYQVVYDGKWTLDKMLEIATAYGEDNGDGTMNMGDDVFGCVSITVPSRLFLFSFGLELITVNETQDGVEIPNALDEKTISSYEKLQAVFPNGKGSSPNCICVDYYPHADFADDRILLYTAYFMHLGSEEIRNMESDYMVLPMPKYDENQDDYISPMSTDSSMALIPLTAVDPEISGMILEYMGYVGQKEIIPVYIEQTLKLKYSRDPQVMEMVQFVLDRSAFTLTQALIWNCEAGGFRNLYAFGSLNIVGSPNIASYYSGYRRVWKKVLDNLLENLS